MSDKAFESELEALFAAPPALGADETFALAVERRLQRRYAARWFAVAGAGVAGAAVALSGVGVIASQAREAADRLIGLAAPFVGVGPALSLAWTGVGLAILGVAAIVAGPRLQAWR